MISSRSAYGKTISCDYGGAALASAGGASAGGQEGFVASGEVEDGTGELDLPCQFGVGGQKLPGTGAGTGTLAASLLDMDFKSSVRACMGGVLLAGCIMGALSVLGVSAFGAVAA